MPGIWERLQDILCSIVKLAGFARRNVWMGEFMLALVKKIPEIRVLNLKSTQSYTIHTK
ncbi:MAG: hypothetical protein SYNGOMJ08_00778 [Candidatus Syntrophoarchaeum sp. GoM_oil]|nr:MAG: hypothetical protein SYNGOMJ08_00778 [Candidatus Syntrophoarchaeum sp. GoM_oil]